MVLKIEILINYTVDCVSLDVNFIVEEIGTDGTILEVDKPIKKEGKEGNFVHFVLQKENLTTLECMKYVGKQLKIGRKRFSYAGTKDKKALTTQLVSCYGIKKEDVERLNIRGIKINGCWNWNEKIRLGDLLGNRFRIRLNAENIERQLNDVKRTFPNYFGPQRFGTTGITHKVGELMVRDRMKDACMLYLTHTEEETNEKAREARKILKETENLKEALNTFPKYLMHERTIINWLSKYPNDYTNAMRKLPRGLLLLFVHSFQSYIFNTLLRERITEGELRIEEGEYCCGNNGYGFPNVMKKQNNGWVVSKIIGYDSKVNERERMILDELGIKKEDFKIKSMPEISSKGSYRTLFAPVKDLSWLNGWISFSLPAGSYATVFLRECIGDFIGGFDE